MTTPDLAGMCERLRERIAYDKKHYPPVDPLFTEAAAAIESLVANNERMREALVRCQAILDTLGRPKDRNTSQSEIMRAWSEVIAAELIARTALEGASDDR